jgi:murein L,D-transpeptidase YcbB/YkuD
MSTPPRRRHGIVAPLVLVVMALTAAGCVGRRPAAPTRDVTESRFAPSIAAVLATSEPSGVEGEAIDVATLRRVYAERRNAPVWIDESGAVDERAEAIAAVLEDAASDGLDPGDYHAAAIRRRLATPAPGDAVALELLLSDGAIRYAVHQASGVRPPSTRDPEAWIGRGDPNAGAIVREIAETPDAGERLRAFAPAQEPYRRLRDALAQHRRIESEGGWPTVPEGVLRPGVTSPAVAALRQRLVISRDLEDGADPSHRYDEALATAVRRFQWRHGIGPDGVVGERTIAALNVPVERRVADIVANMERRRWLGWKIDERYVKVNVPDYSLELVQSGSAGLRMPVVVGRTDWRTPVLSSEIRHIIFNPSWLVPPSITKKEILPKARADGHYLKRFVVRREGLRQPPGPQNPLGRVKFVMPNPLGIYLHDTPSRGGFARSKRALSHGCIRLRDPLDLADALLAGQDGWSDERRKQILSTWRTTSIGLANAMPIYVLYETAWIDELGTLQFRDDVYERDQVLRQQMTDAGRAPLATRSSERRSPARAVKLP